MMYLGNIPLHEIGEFLASSLVGGMLGVMILALIGQRFSFRCLMGLIFLMMVLNLSRQRSPLLDYLRVQPQTTWPCWSYYRSLLTIWILGGALRLFDFLFISGIWGLGAQGIMMVMDQALEFQDMDLFWKTTQLFLGYALIPLVLLVLMFRTGVYLLGVLRNQLVLSWVYQSKYGWESSFLDRTRFLIKALFPLEPYPSWDFLRRKAYDYHGIPGFILSFLI